jgi:hypothetical protein
MERTTLSVKAQFGKNFNAHVWSFDESDTNTATRSSNKKRRRAEDNEPTSAVAGDIDDIAVTPSDSNSEGSLKCPIPSMLMEDPYKRKVVCGHVYEHDAIQDHLKKDKHKRCLVAGCINQGMSEAQLVQDKATTKRIFLGKGWQKLNQNLLAATQDAIEI